MSQNPFIHSQQYPTYARAVNDMHPLQQQTSQNLLVSNIPKLENAKPASSSIIPHTDYHHKLEINPACYPILQNIVSTVNLCCELDLKRIVLQARNAEYNPKRFAAVIIRLRDPKTTALIFASGKMVCTGAKSEEASLTAARKYARMIQKMGFNVSFKDFKIQNIVGSCDVQFPIQLDALEAKHKRFCSYEPELFPGLIYRMLNPKIVLLIFVSGKLVLTGAKAKSEINQAFETIYTVLLECRKQK